MENKERFLPIGSVVLLEGGTKKVMITGFCSVSIDDKTKVYDYTGCVYPEGYLNSNQICLFDHNQIKKTYFIGYESEEEKEFKKTLELIISDYESGEISLDDSDFDEDDDESAEITTDDTNENLEYL